MKQQLTLTWLGVMKIKLKVISCATWAAASSFGLCCPSHFHIYFLIPTMISYQEQQGHGLIDTGFLLEDPSKALCLLFLSLFFSFSTLPLSLVPPPFPSSYLLCCLNSLFCRLFCFGDFHLRNRQTDKQRHEGLAETDKQSHRGDNPSSQTISLCWCCYVCQPR